MATGADKATSLKDWLEFGYKIVTGIVLVAIPFVVKLGADNIAASLQTGQLVQTLIADLTTQEQTARQDIALIALDGAIGESKPEMVVQIAEQVMNSRQETAPEDTVAYRIIKSRAPDQGAEILARLSDSTPVKANEVVESEVARGPTSRSDPSDEPLGQTLTVSADASRIAKAFKSIVYIQFRPEEQRPMAVALQGALRERGWLVPGVERVDANYSNSIRYFHDEDLTLAQDVKQATDAFLGTGGVNVMLPELKDFTSLKAPQTQIEIWIDFGGATGSVAQTATSP